MEVLEKITQAIKLLQEIEKYKEELPALQQEVDYRLSDLLHKIENDSLNAPQSCKIVKEIKKQRLIRRDYQNDYEILRTYTNNVTKLMNAGNREMLLSELKKTNNRLNQPYKNRIYTNDEMNELLGVK